MFKPATYLVAVTNPWDREIFDQVSFRSPGNRHDISDKPELTASICRTSSRRWSSSCIGPGYCFDTVALDSEIIRRYLRYQEKREKEFEQQQLKF